MQAVLLMLAWVLTGCTSISERSHAYLGSPRFPPTNPAQVKILAAEPSQPKDKLGEVMLSIDGNPSREAVEKKLQTGAARLGADAAYVVYDKMHIFPIVYADWWGPAGVSEAMRRGVVAVAIRYK
jgi:hypothetical protein